MSDQLVVDGFPPTGHHRELLGSIPSGHVAVSWVSPDGTERAVWDNGWYCESLHWDGSGWVFDSWTDQEGWPRGVSLEYNRACEALERLQGMAARAAAEEAKRVDAMPEAAPQSGSRVPPRTNRWWPGTYLLYHRGIEYFRPNEEPAWLGESQTLRVGPLPAYRDEATDEVVPVLIVEA